MLIKLNPKFMDFLDRLCDSQIKVSEQFRKQLDDYARYKEPDQ